MANEFKHKDPCTTLTQAEYIGACGDGHIFACQATGDILYASSATVLSKLAKGNQHDILSMGGSNIPAWTASPSVTDLTISGGCITLTGAATDIDLIDNNASALSFDASGKAGIIDIVTTNCSEGVTMSGTLGVTGVMTATGGIELSHACQNTLTGSGGCLSVEGNVVYRAGGTDVPVADGGTGASTLTDGGVLLGSGTSAVTAMAVLADSEMIVGNGTTDPVAESGATLRTSIGVGTGDSPQFTGLTLTGDLSVAGACITLTGAATDVDLIDNNACALSFDASGQAGILAIDTQNCAEGVKMSAKLGVTGVLTATGGIELSHATANTLTASSGVLSIEGNRIFHAGGTDIPVADGGTGASTFTANGILVGNGTSAVAVTATMATKGHVMIGDGSGVPSMLAVGCNNQVLTACSSEGTGVKWAAAAGVTDVSARVSDGSSQTIADNTRTKINFDTEDGACDFDTSSIHGTTVCASSTTSCTRLKAPSDGKYIVSGGFYLANATNAGVYGASIYKNGSIVNGTSMRTFPDVTSEHRYQNVTAIIQLDACEYVELVASLDAAGESVSLAAQAFSMIKIA